MRNQETKEKQRQAYSAIVIDNTLQAMRLQNSHAGTLYHSRFAFTVLHCLSTG
jgi:hypothetical protein